MCRYGGEMIDKTGEPRTPKDFREALDTIEHTIINPPLSHPLLVVHLGIIRDALRLVIIAGEKRHV